MYLSNHILINYFSIQKHQTKHTDQVGENTINRKPELILYQVIRKGNMQWVGQQVLRLLNDEEKLLSDERKKVEDERRKLKK